MQKAFTLKLKAPKSAAAELQQLLEKDRNKQRRDLLMLNIQVHLLNKTAVQRNEQQERITVIPESDSSRGARG